MDFKVGVWVVMGIALGCSSPAPPATPTTIATTATVNEPVIRLDPSRDRLMYESEDGSYRMLVIPVVAEAESTEFLVVARSNAPHGSTVWPAVYVKEKGGSAYYLSQRHGREHWALSARTTISGNTRFESVRYASDAYHAKREVVRLKVSANRVGEAEAKEILAQYIEQQASGHTESVQRWDRKKAEAYYLGKAKKQTDRLHQSCDTPLKYIIDVTAMSDSVLRSTGPKVDAIASLLRTLCSDYPDVAAELATIEELQWTQEGKPGLRKEAGKLWWTPPDRGSNREGEASAREVFGMTKRVAKTKSGKYFYLDSTTQTVYSGDQGTLTKHRLSRKPRASDYREFHLWPDLFSTITGHSGMSIGPSPWTLRCGKAEHEFTELSRSERDAFLSKVHIDNDYLFDRDPFVLARDDRGVYYYVDRVMGEKGGKDYRVYIGRKGAARKTLLKDVVDDSEGLIFETPGGKLRLRIDQNNSRVQHVFWSKRKKRTELTILNPKENGELIFRELGVYDGVALGTVCSLL